MDGKAEKYQIRVIKNGPFLVTGGVPLGEKIITPRGRGYVYTPGRTFPLMRQYTLCRCGKSRNMPYCDGIHVQIRFTGAETASREPFHDRAKTISGPDLDLLDDGRCAYARFCHRERGSAWGLTRASDDPVNKREAIIAASECPTGRLIAVLKSGQELEPELAPRIDLLQDPAEGVSCGIYVQGGIPLISADGTAYERQNRYVLCRCGKSRIMPFCDAMHVPKKFRDGHEQGAGE